MNEPRVPGQPTGALDDTDEHLGLDALAECLASPPPDTSQDGRHLAGCAGCADRLTELRDAEPAVSAALRALPSLPVPDDVIARLDAALGELGADVDAGDALPEAADPASPGPASADPASATVTTLPPPTAATAGRPLRWLTAAAAGLVLLVGGGLGLAQLTRSEPGPTTAAQDSAGAGRELDLVRNDTGTNYADRAALAAAVPSLLDGTAGSSGAALAAPAPAPSGGDAKGGTTGGQPGSGGLPAPQAASGREAADPLARLRTDAGLAECLLALLPPDQPEVQALALDYGSYAGRPALVVVLPGAASGKLDVFVVGPGCSRANDSTLFYTSVASR